MHYHWMYLNERYIFVDLMYTLLNRLLIYITTSITHVIVYYIICFLCDRYLGHLKSYVKNRAQPKGFIVKCYLTEECLTFFF